MRAFLVLLLVVAAAAALWSSRPLVEERPGLGTVRYERLLGRIVAVEVDSDGDGEPEIRTEYSWSEPYREQASSGCVDWSRRAEDRDRNGRPDTWYQAVGEEPDGGCRYLFQADTDGDGTVDWELESADQADAYTRMALLRGF